MRVVFGGSAFGLLGTLADAVLEGGGQLTGIIPEFFTRECDGVSVCKLTLSEHGSKHIIRKPVQKAFELMF